MNLEHDKPSNPIEGSHVPDNFGIRFPHIEIGIRYTATILMIDTSGVMCALNGYTGFIHRKNLPRETRNQYEYAYKPGDTLEVAVIGTNRNGILELSVRAIEHELWDEQVEKFKVGECYTAPVVAVSIKNYSVRLAPFVRGICARQENDEPILHLHDTVEVRVVWIEHKNHMIGLEFVRVVDASQAENPDVPHVIQQDQPAGEAQEEEPHTYTQITPPEYDFFSTELPPREHSHKKESSLTLKEIAKKYKVSDALVRKAAKDLRLLHRAKTSQQGKSSRQTMRYTPDEVKIIVDHIRYEAKH